jgi:hypothetical protein
MKTNNALKAEEGLQRERVSYLEQKVRFLSRHAEKIILDACAKGTLGVPSNKLMEFENTRLKERMAALEHQLRSVHNSVSWRITAPIRRIQLPDFLEKYLHPNQ